MLHWTPIRIYGMNTKHTKLAAQLDLPAANFKCQTQAKQILPCPMHAIPSLDNSHLKEKKAEKKGNKAWELTRCQW